jgi:hypothetical protein
LHNAFPAVARQLTTPGPPEVPQPPPRGPFQSMPMLGNKQRPHTTHALPRLVSLVHPTMYVGPPFPGRAFNAVVRYFSVGAVHELVDRVFHNFAGIGPGFCFKFLPDFHQRLQFGPCGHAHTACDRETAQVAPYKWIPPKPWQGLAPPYFRFASARAASYSSWSSGVNSTGPSACMGGPSITTPGGS